MSVSDADIAFARELFAGAGAISHRRMMGGASLYADGQIFAIVGSDGALWLKAVGALAQELEEAGCRKFASGGKTMGYWSLPEEALDDPELAGAWAQRALDALR